MTDRHANQSAEGHPEPSARRLKRSGSSLAWAGVILAVIVLAALIVFIAQNATPVHVRFLMLRAEFDLGLALLVAGLGGAFLVVVIAGVRIVELRRIARRHSEEAQAAFRHGHTRPSPD